VLPASGRRVVALPVDTAMRWIIGEESASTGRRVAMPVGPVPPMVAPWGEPDPVPGVVMRTSTVPTRWLRRPAPPTTSIALAPTAQLEEQRDVPPPAMRRDPRPMPPSVRVRKAAVMAFGLLISLVAVEAAARVGRR
jgi:hypothetical protein